MVSVYSNDDKRTRLPWLCKQFNKKKPNIGDLSFLTWDAQNSMVIAWIMNSMEEDIKEFYLYYSTTKEM